MKSVSLLTRSYSCKNKKSKLKKLSKVNKFNLPNYLAQSKETINKNNKYLSYNLEITSTSFKTNLTLSPQIIKQNSSIDPSKSYLWIEMCFIKLKAWDLLANKKPNKRKITKKEKIFTLRYEKQEGTVDLIKG